MAQQFDELFVHYGEMVLRDLILSDDGRFLFGATKNRVSLSDLSLCLLIPSLVLALSS